MKNYRNNNKRNRFRNTGERSFYRNGGGQKLNSNFSSDSIFKRKNFGQNNQNASKMVEKYSNLAREALSSGDKILSENYLQHAEHFIRILVDKESVKNKSQNNNEATKENISHEKSKEIEEQNISNPVELNSSES